MELLLNLTWLLLAAPAYWLWRSSRSASAAHRFGAHHGLLALGCMLVILFPVVSATDDLHAMRTEMEESPLSKRSVRPSANDKVSPSKSPVHQALLQDSTPAFVIDGCWQLLPAALLSIRIAPALEAAGRAPPVPLLG